jgi:hypothetical protein
MNKHLRGATDKQRKDFLSLSYKRKLEANRGHNYAYWNEKYDELIDNGGYSIHHFPNRKGELTNPSTYSEDEAKDIVSQLRKEGNFARIVCGYDTNRQRVKTFTVIYKPKKEG